MPAASLVFLTPAAALVALAAGLPLLAAWRGALRARRTRAALRLRPPERRSDALHSVGLALAVALLGLAVAQPALSDEVTQRVRTDAQALFVVDVSRSMAAAQRGGPTRLERAKAAARELRSSIPEVEAGVATLTDRVLPDLLPVADRASFDATLARSVQIGEPPPQETAVRATSYAALAEVPAANYFAREAKTRVLVLLTDGESRPIDESQLARALAAPPGISLVAIRFWSGDETIRDADGTIDPAYRPDPSGALALANLASAARGDAVDEGDIVEARASVRQALGTGPTRPVQIREPRELPLGPYVALVALALLCALALHREGRPGRSPSRPRNFYDQVT